MRIVVCLLVLVAACTKHNPDSCCSTAEQCNSLGIDGITGCQAGKACDGTGTCIATQCSTSAECTTPEAPVCANQLCVASCTTDAECVGIPGRGVCAADGVCVACTEDAQCSTDAPVCDATARACRGCAQDEECPGGICLEAKGTCVADANVLFVQMGGNDGGLCTRLAPCGSFNKVVPLLTAGKQAVKILGTGFPLQGAQTYVFDVPAYVDGSNTQIFGPAAGPALTIKTAVSLSGVRLDASPSASVTISSGGTLQLWDVTTQGVVAIMNGSLIARVSTFNTSQVQCTSGTLDIDRSHFVHQGLMATNCAVTVQHTRFDEEGDGGVQMTGGHAIVENNLFVQTSGGNDCSTVAGVSLGSIVRFNTFVSVDVGSDGLALGCDDTVEVTSNIFAYNSQHPLGQGSTCAPRYSLFDTTALTAQTTGANNSVGDVSTFFVSRLGNDFHLKAGSPALGAGEPTTAVVDDFDGKPRPNPVGSAPDIGALEAP